MSDTRHSSVTHRDGIDPLQVADLLWELTLRDLRIRYKRSSLGLLWALLNPLAQIVIFSFLFVHVMPLGVEHYTTFVFCGVLSWSWFSTAVIGAAGSVIANPELVKRPGFPVGVLPVLSVTSNAVHFLIALPVLLVWAAFDGGRLSVSLLGLVPLIAVQFLLSLACAVPVARLNVRFRDTQHLVAVIFMAAFYLTPIFYSADRVPGALRSVYMLNPMAILLDGYRKILIYGEWPDAGPIIVVAAIAAVLLAWSYRSFTRASMRFAEEL
ncbi:ABC transporter permease [Frigidibacter sp. MR17.24]|uniref:ABC transporter permease n=1 Tax=Frigidibacter sp. MR17.24 TaxID=3127345 RepID=UPI003012A1EB